MSVAYRFWHIHASAKVAKRRGWLLVSNGAIKLPSLETPPNKHLALENQWLEDKISSWDPAYVHGQHPPAISCPLSGNNFQKFP